MAEKTKKILKNFFKGGDNPTTTQYQDLIDSQLNLTEENQTVAGTNTFSGLTTFSGGNNAGVKFLVAGAANVVTAADSGKIIVFNVADATLCTLPEPQIGLKYTFVTKILATGDHEIQAKNNGHGFLGGVTVTSTTAAKADFFSANANGADDFITQTGGTNGGGPGSIITITGVADTSGAGCWLVAGNLGAVGSTVVTPFATS